MNMSRISDWLAGVGRMTLGIVGALVMAISAFFVTFAVMMLMAFGGFTSAMSAIAVSATILVVMGAMIAWRGMQNVGEKHQEYRHKDRQHEILDLAKKHNGHVTVPELALTSRYTVDEVREQLDEFVDKGIAEPGVSERGRQVYVFPEFRGDGDQKTARMPLEDEFDDLEVELGDLDVGEEREEREEKKVKAREYVKKEG